MQPCYLLRNKSNFITYWVTVDQMDIDYANKRLGRQMSSAADIQRHFGQLAKPLQLRLGVLKNAISLADVPRDPPVRCHQLTNDRDGQFAVTLKDNWRLIFWPNHDPIPTKEDGGIDLSKVTAITIGEVHDYHG